MSTQRYVSTSFWDDSFVQELNPQEKLLFLYLLTNPLTNVAGIYKITIRRMIFDTMLTSDEIKTILSKFSAAKKAHLIGEYIIIPSWPKHQQYESRPNIRKGIECVLKELPNHVIEAAVDLAYSYPIDGFETSRTLKDPQGPSRTLTEDQKPSGTFDERPNYLDIDLDIDLDTDVEPEPKPYGSHVKLTDQAMKRLTDRWPKQTVFDYIERVNDYCASKGKRYKNHEATIRNWLKNGKVPEMGTGPPERHSAQPIINTQSLGGKHASASRTPVDGEVTSRPEAVLRNADQPKAFG